MTCIVGINTGSKIIIAGDRMGSNGFTYSQYQPKVFKKDDFIFGVCGSYRIMQLLEHNFTIPERKIKQTTDNFIFNTFTNSVIELCRTNFAAELDKNLISMDATFLFGYEDKLYHMQDNFQSLSNLKGYNACGSGLFHAISSLYSTENLNISPEERLKKAINCANEFVMSVDNKVDMVELVYKEEKETKKTKIKSKK